LDSVQGSFFDHKSVHLRLNKKVPVRRPKRLIIQGSILSDPDIDVVAWYSLIETYLHHLTLDGVTRQDVDNTLILVGRVRQLLKDAGPDLSYYQNNITEEIINTRELNLVRINRIIENYPIELLYNFELNITDDLFLEVLINNFRNDVTSNQDFIFKFKKREKVALSNDLRVARAENDSDLIDSLEDKLSRLNEQEIRDRLQSSCLYEHLNNEKMTPLFLNLAKISKGSASLSDILQPGGAAFETDRDRKKYILDFYETLYENNSDPETVPDIETFLGPEIVRHPLVTSSKLSAEQCNFLEQDLTLQELDNSISSAKLASAGGMDGLNNRTLKKFWRFF
jgi:hypothetical protein